MNNSTIIKCAVCGKEIEKAKRISIKKHTWNKKSGDSINKIEVCFSCYRLDKYKEFRSQYILIIVFLVMGISTILLSPSLASLSAEYMYTEYEGLSNEPLPYILMGLLFVGLAGFFYRVNKKQKIKLEHYRILYE